MHYVVYYNTYVLMNVSLYTTVIYQHPASLQNIPYPDTRIRYVYMKSNQ